MRLLRFISALWVISMTVHAQQDKEDPFTFSQVIGSLKFIDRTDYEEPQLGYSLRYQNDEMLKADIYVYDNSYQGLRDGIHSEEVQAEMKQAEASIRYMEEQGKYDGVKELKQGEKETKPSGLKFLWARYSLRQIGGEEAVYVGRRISDTFLRAHRGKFIKIRITIKESDLIRDGREIERFVDQVAACLP